VSCDDCAATPRPACVRPDRRNCASISSAGCLVSLRRVTLDMKAWRTSAVRSSFQVRFSRSGASRRGRVAVRLKLGDGVLPPRLRVRGGKRPPRQEEWKNQERLGPEALLEIGGEAPSAWRGVLRPASGETNRNRRRAQVKDAALPVRSESRVLFPTSARDPCRGSSPSQAWIGRAEDGFGGLHH